VSRSTSNAVALIAWNNYERLPSPFTSSLGRVAGGVPTQSRNRRSSVACAKAEPRAVNFCQRHPLDQVYDANSALFRLLP
jgi:hypothetical protein